MLFPWGPLRPASPSALGVGQILIRRKGRFHPSFTSSSGYDDFIQWRADCRHEKSQPIEPRSRLRDVVNLNSFRLILYTNNFVDYSITNFKESWCLTWSLANFFLNIFCFLIHKLIGKYSWISSKCQLKIPILWSETISRKEQTFRFVLFLTSILFKNCCVCTFSIQYSLISIWINSWINTWINFRVISE